MEGTKEVIHATDLSPTIKKVIDSVVMSVICVLLENQVSGHPHGIGMIAAHLPVAYLHESLCKEHQGAIRNILLGIGGFIIFHGGIHVIAENMGTCEHPEETVRYLGYKKFQYVQQAHTSQDWHLHGLNIKTWIGVGVGALGEEIYSHLSRWSVKHFFTHQTTPGK